MVLRISLASLLSLMLGAVFFSAKSAADLVAKDVTVEIQGSRADVAIPLFVEQVGKVASVGAGQSWQRPRSPEQMLPESIDCWEPALAVGPSGQVYVVAGRRHGKRGDKDFDQKQVIWRSENRGPKVSAISRSLRYRTMGSIFTSSMSRRRGQESSPRTMAAFRGRIRWSSCRARDGISGRRRWRLRPMAACGSRFRPCRTRTSRSVRRHR